MGFGGGGTLLLGAAGFFVYYFTLGGGSMPASPENIDIVVSGPPQVAGGEPTEMQISITNRNKIPLELADLVVTYPPGTRSASDYQTDLPTQRIPLGTINAGARQQGTVSAVFSGKEGETANVKVELEYHTEGSNSVFVADANYGVTLSTAPLSLSVDGNTETIAGQPLQLMATVASNSNAPVKDVLMSVNYPFGFKETSATPKETAPGFWALGDFAPGAKRTVTIQGTLTGQSGDDRIFTFKTGTRSDTSHDSVDTPLSTAALHTTISQPFLDLSMDVNGSDAANTSVKPGDKVTVTINYENNLQAPITDAIIVAKLSGLDIDGSSLEVPDGFYRSSDDSLYWDKTTTGGALGQIAPGAKGSLTFTFQAPTQDQLTDKRNPYMDISLNAAGTRINEASVPETLQSATQSTISIASDVQLLAEGLYYTNPFGSSGPMPAEAGTETTYAIVFTIRNSTNKILHAKLKALLPPYVRWIGIYSPATENLQFNQADGSVTWNVGTIDAGVGINNVDPRQAAIAIGFTPSTSQIGQTPSLIQNIELTGDDASSTLPVDIQLSDVTTNLSQVSKSSPDIDTAGEAQFSTVNAAVVKGGQ